MKDFDLRKYLAENKLLKEDIDTFLNSNFDEVKEKIGNIPFKFKTRGDSKVATAGEGEKGIDISFDREHMLSLFPEEDPFNKVESIDIAGKTVYYNDYLAENKLLKEDIKFNDYVEVNQAEFDRLYDRLVDEFDGSVEDFIEEYGRDFLGPNIEAINQYYGDKVYADDVITDFFEAGGVDNISSNEEFEAWLDKNREFYLAENKPIKEYSWDDEDFDEEEEEVNDIYSEYTSQDGWDEDALEDVGLMELISEVERLAYEVRTARRGSYANFGDTGEELKNYLEELGRSFTQISNNM